MTERLSLSYVDTMLCLYIYPLIDIQVVSFSWLLWIVLHEHGCANIINVFKATESTVITLLLLLLTENLIFLNISSH